MEAINSVKATLWEFKGLSEVTDKKFLMSTPFPTISILIVYLWFILKFGPEFMKNRKPYKLDRILPIYNLVQVLMSFYLMHLGLRIVTPSEAINVAWNSPTCYSEISYPELATAAHFYFVSKVVELLDTVFFVLRKKQNQVSFLHVYHHTTMAFCTWCVAKYSASDSAIFVGMMNGFVHIVMYSYYGLSVFPGLTKYLWWKKYITVLQLVQFCLMFLNIVIGHFVSSCQKSYILLASVTFNTVFFFYLFGDFYLKCYKKKNVRENKNVLEKTKESHSNSEMKNGLNHLINHRKLAAKIN